MPRSSQLPLPVPLTWGGRRKRAGRKPNAQRAMVSRKQRPRLNGRHPVHVTMRVLPEIPSLRVLNGWVRRALFASADQPRFRIIHFSIQGTHIHVIAEADDSLSLSRGMQGLAIRIARAVNQALSRKRGKVFSDRYHEHVLKTPSEVRAAIHYVIHNYSRDPARTAPVGSPALPKRNTTCNAIFEPKAHRAFLAPKRPARRKRPTKFVKPTARARPADAGWSRRGRGFE